MKKLLLLAGLALSNFVAIAQQNQSVVFSNKPVAVPNKKADFNKFFSDRKLEKNATANKGTAGGSRWYNFVDLMNTIDPSVINNDNYNWLWDKPNLLAKYGTTYDTIWIRSFATALDPSTTLFNTSSLYPGEIAINSTNPYTVDSVTVYGYYDRKSTSNSVDTLVISLVTGTGVASTTNMPTSMFVTSSSFNVLGIYGKDTLRFPNLFHDVNKNIVNKNPNAASASNVITVTKLLTSASIADTNSVGMGVFKFKLPTPMSVVANGIVGVGVTYKYGGTYPVLDTLYSSTNAVKYNSFMPIWFEQNANLYPTYYNGDLNCGYLATIEPTTSSWYGDYVPTWAFTSATYSLEYPLIDIKLSCATCNITAVADVKSTIESVIASPNPATEVMAISFNTTENATTKVAIMNMLGQEVDAKTISAVANTSNKVVFNVANLNAGIYLYSITSNGQTVSNRFVVAH